MFITWVNQGDLCIETGAAYPDHQWVGYLGDRLIDQLGGVESCAKWLTPEQNSTYRSNLTTHDTSTPPSLTELSLTRQHRHNYQSVRNRKSKLGPTHDSQYYMCPRANLTGKSHLRHVANTLGAPKKVDNSLCDLPAPAFQQRESVTVYKYGWPRGVVPFN
ncbi:hypothetical protein J6590_025387 [Homalodisca vitripennis]|nr:hypothetical protein J6590_025387 [Homalodisca vitripennis]